MRTSKMTRGLLLALMAGVLVAGIARADDDDERESHEHARGRERHHEGGEHHGGHRERSGLPSAALRTTAQWATYTAECGSCHMAFPPHMLPAKSWSVIMGGLADHFGSNAEVDAATRRTLDVWLAENGSREGGDAPLRITSLGWWRREHDEIDTQVYKRKAIMSPANCAACHPGANEGAFGEHQVKIPHDAPSAR